MTGSGTAGETEMRVISFISFLKTVSGVPVFAEDERMSSKMADSAVRAAGGKMKDFDRDAMAAAAILESHMTKLAREEEAE
jgi:RNase H-fold protein (predicted Holliday junction resolvase)